MLGHPALRPSCPHTPASQAPGGTLWHRGPSAGAPAPGAGPRCGCGGLTGMAPVGQRWNTASRTPVSQGPYRVLSQFFPWLFRGEPLGWPDGTHFPSLRAGRWARSGVYVTAESKAQPSLCSRMPVALVLISDRLAFPTASPRDIFVKRPCWGSKSLKPTGGCFPRSQRGWLTFPAAQGWGGVGGWLTFPAAQGWGGVGGWLTFPAPGGLEGLPGPAVLLRCT